MGYRSTHPFPFAHIVYFQLADRALPMAQAFMEACRLYLSPLKHKGQLHFSVGLRAVDIARDVSATDFDVAMHIIFEDRASYDVYAASRSHEDFITATAGMSTGRRVFDAYIYDGQRGIVRQALARVASGKGRSVRGTR